MKSVRQWLLSALLLALPALAEPDRWLGEFPQYPGASALGPQFVNPQICHVEWQVYASPDEPEQVREFYRRHFPRMPAGGPFSVQIGRKTLSVHSSQSPDLPDHAWKSAPNVRTVIILTQTF